MQKMTKREMFTQIASHLSDSDEIAFIERQIELLDNQAAKPTAAQKINDQIKENILGFLDGEDDGMTATDLARKCECAVQKVSALLKQLVDAKEVIRIEGVKNAKTKFFI